MKSKAFKLLLFALATLMLARFTHHQTNGFRMSKINSNTFLEEEFEERPLAFEESEILKGKFTYFGRGLQSFAFLSEDEKYVLKIFNNRIQKKLKFFELLHLETYAKMMKSKLHKTYESYKIAYQELREETGILYLHLSPTYLLDRTVVLVDKLGIEHTIDLDNTGFLLQKRAILVYPQLEKLLGQGKIEVAKESLSNLLNLFVTKFQKGIADNDPLIRTNYGFIGTSPLQIDVGPFSKNIAMQNPNVYFPELLRITTSLKHWLRERSPELSDYVETYLQRLDPFQLKVTHKQNDSKQKISNKRSRIILNKY